MLCSIRPVWALGTEEGDDQLGSIHGVIYTSDGAPAPAVTVLLKGTNKNAQTDDKGHFNIRRITPGDYTLQISLMGYNPVQQAVAISTGKATEVAITLEVSNQDLKEVIIAGNKANKFTRSTSGDVGKIQLNRLENAQTYSVITAELLSDQVALSQDDALKNATGLTQMWKSVGRPGAGGSIYLLRGFSTTSNFRNGMPAPVQSSVDVVNAESIEVIKGPSATLFGSSQTSYGGLINRVTKKPFDGRGGEIGFTAGSYGLSRATVDLNTPLDSAHQVLFRLNGAFNSEGSWQDNGFARNLAFAPSVSYKVNDRLTLNLDAEINHRVGTGFPMFFYPYWLTTQQLGANNPEQLNIDYKRSYQSNDLSVTSDNYNFFGEAVYKMSNNWTSHTLVTTARSTSEGAMPYFYPTLGDSIIRMVWRPSGYDNVLDVQQNFNGDFKIGNLRNRLVAGLDFYHYNSNIYYREFVNQGQSDYFDQVKMQGNDPAYVDLNKDKVDNLYNTLPAPAYPYTIIYKTNTYSAYVNDVLNVTDRLLVMAGVRLDYYDNKGTFNLATGKINDGSAYHQVAASPKFGAVYQVIKDQLSVFGNYQNGFTNQQGADSAGHTFRPEQANQWEAGVKTDLFNGRLSGTISYYDIKVKDIVRADPTHPNFSIQNGTQRSKGLEVEVVANPLAGLNITAGYAYNDSKYLLSDASTEGRRPGTAGPANLANLWISYRISGGAAKGLGFGFGGNYADKNKIINYSPDDVFYLPSYTVLNAAITYDRAKFRLALKLNNLTDKLYFTGYSTFNAQTPRQLVASAAFRF